MKNKWPQRGNTKKTIINLALIASLGAGIAVFTNGCKSDHYTDSTGVSVDDKAIEAKIKSELLADAEVKGLAVKVEVNNGRVQLSGFVDSMAQKNRVGELAHQVENVNYVKNDLLVK